MIVEGNKVTKAMKKILNGQKVNSVTKKLLRNYTRVFARNNKKKSMKSY